MSQPASAQQALLVPCKSCGRTFLPDALVRHQGICASVFKRKRRVFESGRQRIAGTGISITKVVKPGQVKKQGVKKTRWREKHADFINAIRSARQAQHAVRTGKPLPPPPAPSINPDYIQCPHCRRRFNQTAGARHIGFCGERTNTFGAPVKPLNKRAAADVGGSKVATRKAYDNIIVRRKPAANPFAYAQDGKEGVEVFSTAFGGSGPEPAKYAPTKSKSTSPKRNISSARQLAINRTTQSHLSPSPRQQQLSPRLQQSPRQQPSPRQQSSPRQRALLREESSPRFKSHSRADTSSPASSKVQSSFPPARGPLPPATSRHRASSLDLSPPRQSSWQPSHSHLRQMPSPPQEPSPLAPDLTPFSTETSERTLPDKLSSSGLWNCNLGNPKSAAMPKMVPPPPLPGKLLPWQQAIMQSSSGDPPRSTALPNGHIRRSRLVKSGRPRGSVRFAENVQVKTFGDTLPYPEDSGMPNDLSGPPSSNYATSNAMTNYFDDHAISQHQDLMSVLKNNYGSDVMLATPGNHVEEMMNSRHPVHQPPNYDSLGGMGLLDRSSTMGDILLQSTALKREGDPWAASGASRIPSNPAMRTSYQDSYGKGNYHSFESTTPLDLGIPSGSGLPQGSSFGPPGGRMGRHRTLGGSLSAPSSTKPLSSDFSKLSISGNVRGSSGRLM